MNWRELISTNIITHLGLHNIDEKKRLQLLAEIADLLQKQIMVRLIEFLNDEEIREFFHLLEHNEDKELSKFLDEKVPNLEEIVYQEVDKLKQDMAAVLS